MKMIASLTSDNQQTPIGQIAGLSKAAFRLNFNCLQCRLAAAQSADEYGPSWDVKGTLTRGQALIRAASRRNGLRATAVPHRAVNHGQRRLAAVEMRRSLGLPLWA
ncbi:hypothetical protein [Streptomyces sp. NPDC127038]|uniref:hypothetical protein n=1 Tax=Streptomyces sp. NPDC127038 TaxID=3347114 RepID=UPI0036627669